MALEVSKQVNMHMRSGSQGTDTFVTARGRAIRHIPGYFEFIEKIMGLPAGRPLDRAIAEHNQGRSEGPIDVATMASLNRSWRKPLSVMGYAARALTVYRMKRLLDATDLTFPVGKLLDIGCAFALQARIIKALGMVREAAGIDLYDRASAIDERHIVRQHRTLRLYKWVDRWQERIDRKPSSQWSDFERAFMLRFGGPRNYAKYRQSFALGSDFYDMKFVKPPRLDRLLVQDFFTLEEKFDFITAFSSMEWFDADRAMAKISSLLNEGGIFYMYIENWWHSISSESFGHFPFAPQRMERADFRHYLSESLPKYASGIQESAELYDASHPTLRDYVNIGWRHGLLALRYEQDVPYGPGHKKYGITSRGWGELDPQVLDDALADIQSFRPDVELTDLLASNTYLLFKKVDRSRRITQRDYSAITSERDFKYRPSNPLMRPVKSIAKKIMWTRTES